MTRIARSSGLLVAALLGLGLPTICQASPFGLRLSYTDDQPGTVTVTWNTTAQVSSEVRFGTATGVYPSSELGTTQAAPGELGFVHEVTLTGLEPDTRYFYVAGESADGYSAEHSFTTRPLPHPTCGAMSFVVLGDNRPDPTFGGGENWADILGQATGQRPSFIVDGGDLVTDGDNLEGWVDFLDWTESAAASIPFMPAIGNHDNGPGEGDGANYNLLFALPRAEGPNGSGTEDYYFFTFAHAIVAVLSSESFLDGASPMAEQAAWLDRVLTENPRKWKFVVLHKPIYTNEVLFDISHAPNEEGQNAALVPVFDAHHVDVVFTSHNHWYERFEPSACASQGQPGSDEPCPVGEDNFSAGTVYYVTGGAGAFTIPGFLCGWQAGRATCAGDHHYLLATLDNEVLTLQTWGAHPQEHRVMDTITIVKPADACDDACPDDPLKTEPGLCGCGVPDSDRDGDATPDCLDGCPDDPAKTLPGACGCGVPDADRDGDATPDCLDGCPDDPAKALPGACGCGAPEVDPCQDTCPEDPHKTAPGACGCGVPDTDRDGDATPDCLDGCPDDPAKALPGACGCGAPEQNPCQDLCPYDPRKTEPGICGCGAADTDRDADGTADCLDLCPDDPLKTAPGPEGCGTQDQATGCGCGTAAFPDAWAGTLLLLVALAARRRARSRG